MQEPDLPLVWVNEKCSPPPRLFQWTVRPANIPLPHQTPFILSHRSQVLWNYYPSNKIQQPSAMLPPTSFSVFINCNVKIWNRSQVTGPSHYAIFYGIDWQPINFQTNIFTATRIAVQYSGVVGGPLQCHSALLRFNGIHLFKKGILIKIKIYRIIFAFEKSFFLFDMAFLTRGYWNFWYGYYNEKQNPLKPWDFEFDHSLNRLHIVLI